MDQITQNELLPIDAPALLAKAEVIRDAVLAKSVSARQVGELFCSLVEACGDINSALRLFLSTNLPEILSYIDDRTACGVTPRFSGIVVEAEEAPQLEGSTDLMSESLSCDVVFIKATGTFALRASKVLSGLNPPPPTIEPGKGEVGDGDGGGLIELPDEPVIPTLNYHYFADWADAEEMGMRRTDKGYEPIADVLYQCTRSPYGFMRFRPSTSEDGATVVTPERVRNPILSFEEVKDSQGRSLTSTLSEMVRAEEAGEVLEAIEPNIVTGALRKTEQALTPDERAQVLHNLGLETLKMELFNDMWVAATDKYGGYDPDNAPNPKKPYLCNREWFSYEEALIVYQFSHTAVVSDMTGLYMSSLSDYALRNTLRTVLPIRTRFNENKIENAFRGCVYLKSISFLPSANSKVVVGGNFNNVFNGCKALREILTPIRISYGTSTTNAFKDCVALEHIEIEAMSSISFADSPLLSLHSVQYMVQNYFNTTAVTITVHADVYAKLTGDTTNEAAAALSAEELEAWGAVLTAAGDKNITFITA